MARRRGKKPDRSAIGARGPSPASFAAPDELDFLSRQAIRELRRAFEPPLFPADEIPPGRVFLGPGFDLAVGKLPRPHRPPVRSTAVAFWPSNRVVFATPHQVPVCRERQERKEVLHAHGVAGRTGLRSPRRGPLSHLSCRR